MCDSHLIAYSGKAVMGCLFGFSVAKTRKILLNGLPVLKYFFEFFAVSGNSRTGIIGNIKVFCTTVAFAGIE